MASERPKSTTIESRNYSPHPLAESVRAQIAQLPPENPVADHGLTFLSPPSDEGEAKRIRQTHAILRELAEGKVNSDTIEASLLKPLELLGAIDEKRELTDIGLEMAVLPFEPRMGRMIVEAQKRDCLEATLVMASFLTVEDVFANEAVEARASFTRSNSDWLTALNIFEQAVSHGLFEWADGNTVDAAEFKRWCEEHHLEPEALKKVVKQLLDLWQSDALDSTSTPETWAELCRTTSTKDLTAVILAGNADRIFSQDPNTSRGDDAIYSATFSSEWAHRDTQKTNCNHARGHFVAGSVKDLGDGRYKENVISQLHPVDTSDMVVALPHLVEVAPASRGGWKKPIYDPASDRALGLHYVHKKNDGPYPRSLGETWQPMTLASENDKYFAKEAFVEYLVAPESENHDLLPFIAENQRVLRRLEHLFHCAKHDPKYDRPNLRRWYEERLNDCVSVSEILEAGLLENGGLNLKMEEIWKDPELLAEYNRKYPAEFHFQGKRIPISYRRPFASSRFSEARLTATFDLSNLSVDELLALTEENIPHISNENFDTDLAFFTQINLHPAHGVGVHSYLCNLQWEIKNLVVFVQWISTQVPVMIPMNPQWRALPTVEALGFNPKEIGFHSDGFPVTVYPEIKPIFNPSHGLSHFEMSYTLRPDVMDAARSFAETEFGRQRRFLDSQAKRAEAERIRQNFHREHEANQTHPQASRPQRHDRSDGGQRRGHQGNQNSGSGRGNFGTMAGALEEALKKKGKQK